MSAKAMKQGKMLRNPFKLSARSGKLFASGKQVGEFIVRSKIPFPDQLFTNRLAFN